jgi:hypothetical protein
VGWCMTELLAYIHTIILMCYNNKMLRKGCFIRACYSIVN